MFELKDAPRIIVSPVKLNLKVLTLSGVLVVILGGGIYGLMMGLGNKIDDGSPKNTPVEKQVAAEMSSRLVLEPPQTDIPPKFFLKGQITEVIKLPSWAVEIKEDITGEFYIALIDKSTNIQLDNPDLYRSGQNKASSFESLGIGQHVAVTGGNFAGRKTLKATNILIANI